MITQGQEGTLAKQPKLLEQASIVLRDNHYNHKTELRIIQELPDRKSIETTFINTYVLNRGICIRSPLD